MYIPDGTYHIVNLETGGYAGLLDERDRLEVVNLTSGLDTANNIGLNVNMVILMVAFE